MFIAFGKFFFQLTTSFAGVYFSILLNAKGFGDIILIELERHINPCMDERLNHQQTDKEYREKQPYHALDLRYIKIRINVYQ